MLSFIGSPAKVAIGFAAFPASKNAKIAGEQTGCGAAMTIGTVGKITHDTECLLRRV